MPSKHMLPKGQRRRTVKPEYRATRGVEETLPPPVPVIDFADLEKNTDTSMRTFTADTTTPRAPFPTVSHTTTYPLSTRAHRPPPPHGNSLSHPTPQTTPPAPPRLHHKTAPPTAPPPPARVPSPPPPRPPRRAAGRT